MISTEYRIYPRKAEQEKLEFSLNMCRIAYNYLLEQLNKGVKGRTNLSHTLLKLKEQDERFEQVYSKAVQPQCDKLCFNLRALGKLKQKGHKVGRLRFKGKGWFNSFSYNQSGFALISKGKKGILHLSKIGDIRINLHREIEGKIKQITLKKSCEKWYAIVVSNANPKRECGKGEIGIDLGLSNYIMDSDGNSIKHPHIFNKYHSGLKKAQQNLSRKKKGSQNRIKARLRVEKWHHKIAYARKDFLHKLSAKLVSENQLIIFENLNIKGLIQIQHNAKNIMDASWGMLVQFTNYKAENAGCIVKSVNPKRTSKTCNSCGNIQYMPLHKREFLCEKCGIRLDRDLNASKNIKSLGEEIAIVERMSDFPQKKQFSMKQEATFGRW
jgi:putative transposase